MENTKESHVVELYDMYYNLLWRQWLDDTYGNCFFYPDGVVVRVDRFRSELVRRYDMEFNEHGGVEFHNEELYNQFFKEAEQAYLMQVLSS